MKTDVRISGKAYFRSVELFHAIFPYRRISGQKYATAPTTRIVPMPPVTTEKIAPVVMALPSAGPARCATKPDSNPPSSFDVPMKRKTAAQKNHGHRYFGSGEFLSGSFKIRRAHV